MTNFGLKAKSSKKSMKKARKVSARISRPAPRRDGGLTAEDISEINLFGAALAKMNWEAEKKNWAKIVAKAKVEPKAKHKA
ncbi:MAG: hypothetical protein LV480_12695 [Methylacidiphilales bacterium]|nr:hypothetical protein [Candidatus Methylacidiphilales bacterium]